MLRLLLIAALCCACRSNTPSEIVPDLPEGPIVLVKEVQIPSGEPWYAQWAVHSWVEYRHEGTWTRFGIPTQSGRTRINVIDPDQAADDVRWSESVRILDVVTGERAAAIIAVLQEDESLRSIGTYRAFPGPNSNTLVEDVIRATPLTTQLCPNAIGRHYAPFRAGVTGSQTGLELETPYLGAEVGLREGVQLHVLQLPVGVRFWPPALLVPLLPALGPRW